jgi:hypothetical protein
MAAIEPHLLRALAHMRDDLALALEVAQLLALGMFPAPDLRDQRLAPGNGGDQIGINGIEFGAEFGEGARWRWERRSWTRALEGMGET